MAVDPLYFEGEFAGADAVFVSDVPYQVTPCDDRSFKADGGGFRVEWWMLWPFVGLVGVGLMRWIGRRIY